MFKERSNLRLVISPTSGRIERPTPESFLKKRLGEISTGRFIGLEADKVTIRELSEDLENDYEVNGKKSLDKARRTVKHLLAFFGDYRAHDISTDLVRKYVAIRMQEKAANATINRELAALKRMYN